MSSDTSSLHETQSLRLRVLGIVAFCLLSALFARLWYLQVLETNKFQARASNNVLRIIHEEAPRGRIFDAKGRVLVDNEITYAIVVDPGEFTEKLDEDAREKTVVELARLLSLSGNLTKAADISKKLVSQVSRPSNKVTVALDIDFELLTYLGEQHRRFPGVSVEERTVRRYPYGDTGAHVLGYVGAINLEEYQAKLARIDSSNPNAKTYQIGDEIGKSGVERTFEDVLRGIPGRRVVEVNVHNEIVQEHPNLSREPKPGNDVYLTIDVDIQQLLEKQLYRGLEQAKTQPIPATETEEPESNTDVPEFVAPAGAGVALDPRDGSILAMASYPTYDPSKFSGGISQSLFEELISSMNHSPILNRAIQGEYPPGSTFKIITAYAALTQGVIGDSEDALLEVDDFYTDIGVYRYPGCSNESDTCIFRSPYCCKRGVDLRDAIAVSSDSYFYRLGGEGFFQRQEPHDEGIQLAARLFGFGSESGVPLPSERSGVVPDRDYYDLLHAEGVFQRDSSQWYAGDTINLAIGQGTLLATPLQIANAYAVLANGGKLYQPNIAQKITDRSGHIAKKFGPRLAKEIPLPPQVISPLLDGLNSTTSYTFEGGENLTGTAYRAFNDLTEGGVDFPLRDWPVAGKTGTAEKQGKADSALFVGFGPASWPELGLVNTPEIVVAIVLEEAGFGGTIAAPAVARFLLPIAEDTIGKTS